MEAIFSDDNVAGLLRYVSQMGVYFGGAAAFLFYLFQAYMYWGRTFEQTVMQKLGSLLLLVAAAASTGFAFFTFTKDYERKSATHKAAVAITEEFGRCMTRVNTISEATLADIQDKAGAPADLQCLALAHRLHAPRLMPQPGAALMLHDMELGFGLINPETVGLPRPVDAPDDENKLPTIGDTLWLHFGINSDTFLGTGFSLPGVTIGKNTLDYGDAALREYLVPNVCADTKSPNLCPQRDPSTWGWTLPMSVLLDRQLTVKDIILKRQPNEGATALAKVRAAIEAGTEDSVLIRFQKFDEGRYTGKVGRPQSRYVFFSELQGTYKLSLRDAFQKSGQTDFERDAADPNKRAFVWIQVPDGGHFNRQATWRSVFSLLGEIDADARLAEPKPTKK